MAGEDDQKPKAPAIPSWQQVPPQPEKEAAPSDAANEPQHNELDPIEQARLFLQHDEIKDAPHDEKVAFLEKKGLQSADIQKLLGQLDNTSNTSDDGLRTIHDSTATASDPPAAESPLEATSTPPSSSSAPANPSPPSEISFATVAPKADMPPIITYPEFLMKPQKPPPLVTIHRLATASYIIGGVSALTWAASKYLIAPMLESLTASRHDLAFTTLTSLDTLNTKLESSVSHIPYIAPLKPLKPTDDALSDTSSDSDPTELFHRDHGTQTSPPKSRSSSTSSPASPLNPTTSQTTRLTSLHSSLSSLLSSTAASTSTEALSTSVSRFQSIIDVIESNSTPLYTSYKVKSAPLNSSSNTTTGVSTTKSKAADANSNTSEAAKFKNEIRALKGAFLSSRNFPTPPRPPAVSAVSAGSIR